MDINYFKRTFKFSEDTSIPLYEQLTSYIKIQIQAGVLKPGDKMITENELCEILNVSRTTVRQSMNKLVEQKFIYRYRGKGSFIADQKVKRAINYLYNFTEDMRKLGTVPSSIVLKSEVVNLEEARACACPNPTVPSFIWPGSDAPTGCLCSLKIRIFPITCAMASSNMISATYPSTTRYPVSTG